MVRHFHLFVFIQKPCRSANVDKQYVKQTTRANDRSETNSHTDTVGNVANTPPAALGHGIHCSFDCTKTKLENRMRCMTLSAS
jgi:hypothetical protein